MSYSWWKLQVTVVISANKNIGHQQERSHPFFNHCLKLSSSTVIVMTYGQSESRSNSNSGVEAEQKVN